MKRKSDYPILDVILNRTSNYKMTGEHVSDDELMTILEAARWAPSYNNQPWRFIYAKKGTQFWDTFFDLLAPLNQKWAIDADVLILLISKKIFDYNKKPSITHQLDAGAAWENLAIQGTSMGLVVHAMEGFDYSRSRSALSIPDEYDIECMIAIGKPDKTKQEEPTTRKKLQQIVFEGRLHNG